MVLHGEFHPDFGRVAESLIAILPKHSPGGAALCIYHGGEKVVDIWGGTRDVNGQPWQKDTLAFSASTTKGVASTMLHILVDRGLAQYDDKIAQHWPEFAQNGKDNITIRQAMSHQAGLYGVNDSGFRKEHFADWSAALRVLEQAQPLHAPAGFSAYHALTYGHLIGGLVEKISGQSFQEFMRQELAEPLGLDGLFVGVPDEELHRLAKLVTLDGNIGLALKKLKNIPPGVSHVLSFIGKILGFDFSHFAKALIPDFIDQICFNEPEAMQYIIPAANGAFTARSLAKMYAMLANGGELEGKRIVSPERVKLMAEQQTTGRDKVVNFPMRWRLGYHQIYTMGKSNPHAFGHFGLGGSGAWCDPSRQLSMAMTLNSGVGTPLGDLRIVKLSGDVIRCADRRAEWQMSRIPQLPLMSK